MLLERTSEPTDFGEPRREAPTATASGISSAGAVVGRDRGDFDPEAREVGAVSGPERCGGLLAFVGQDLGGRQSGVVVHDVAHEPVSA